MPPKVVHVSSPKTNTLSVPAAKRAAKPPLGQPTSSSARTLSTSSNRDTDNSYSGGGGELDATTGPLLLPNVALNSRSRGSVSSSSPTNRVITLSSSQNSSDLPQLFSTTSSPLVISTASGQSSFPSQAATPNVAQGRNPVVPLPPLTRRTSKRNRASITAKNFPTAVKNKDVEVNKIIRWWAVAKARLRVQKRLPTKFAAEHVLGVLKAKEVRVAHARAVVREFIIKCFSRLRGLLNQKRLVVLAGVSSIVAAFCRAQQSTQLVDRLRSQRLRRCCKLMLQYWRRSEQFARRERNILDDGYKRLVAEEEMMERRENERRERLAFLLLTREFLSAPSYQRFLEAQRQERLRVLSYAARYGKTEDEVVSLFGVSNKADDSPRTSSYSTARQAVKRAVALQRAAVLGGQRSFGEDEPSISRSSRRRSSVNSSFSVERRTMRKSSLLMQQLASSGAVNLHGLLGAGVGKSRSSVSSGKGAPVSGAALIVSENSVRVEHGEDPGGHLLAAVGPQEASLAGLSFFGEDIENLESVTSSPLLAEYSRRGAASSNDRALMDARMQMLNQQFLYPLRTSNYAANGPTAQKQCVSETFLGEGWSSWFTTADLLHGAPTTAIRSKRVASFSLERKQSSVCRKRVGGEYSDAQRRLSVASPAAPNMGARRSLSKMQLEDPEDVVPATLARYSSRRNSEITVRQNHGQRTGPCWVVGGEHDAKHPSNKGLALPAGSLLFSIDFEVERLILREHSQRMRFASQSQRILSELRQQMEDERTRDLADLVPRQAARHHDDDQSEAMMFMFGKQMI